MLVRNSIYIRPYIICGWRAVYVLYYLDFRYPSAFAESNFYSKSRHLFHLKIYFVPAANSYTTPPRTVMHSPLSRTHCCSTSLVVRLNIYSSSNAIYMYIHAQTACVYIQDTREKKDNEGGPRFSGNDIHGWLRRITCKPSSVMTIYGDTDKRINVYIYTLAQVPETSYGAYWTIILCLGEYSYSQWCFKEFRKKICYFKIWNLNVLKCILKPQNMAFKIVFISHSKIIWLKSYYIQTEAYDSKICLRIWISPIMSEKHMITMFVDKINIENLKS
jgi:hypothetical protein